MKKALVLSLVFILGAAFALAGAQIDGSVQKATPYEGTAAASYSAISGNIYNMSLTAEEQTYRWVAFFGNLTGTIVLKDSSDNTFYSWNAKAEGSVIYARTENIAPAISSLAAVSDATVIDTDYTFPNDASDNVASTYTKDLDLTTPSGVTVTGTKGVKLVGHDPSGGTGAVGAGTWYNFVLTDGTGTATGQYIWAVNATDYGKAYNGMLANYELLIPEDGQKGDTTGTVYYFWVELK